MARRKDSPQKAAMREMMRDYLEKHNLETSGRYLRQPEQIKILTGKQFVNINCGVCNDCNGK